VLQKTRSNLHMVGLQLGIVCAVSSPGCSGDQLAAKHQADHEARQKAEWKKTEEEWQKAEEAAKNGDKGPLLLLGLKELELARQRRDACLIYDDGPRKEEFKAEYKRHDNEVTRIANRLSENGINGLLKPDDGAHSMKPKETKVGAEQPRRKPATRNDNTQQTRHKESNE